MAIKASGITLAAVGGVLVYTGLSSGHLLDSIRTVLSGNAPAPIALLTSATAGVPGNTYTGTNPVFQGNPTPGSVGAGSGFGVALVGAARGFSGDIYSQAKRNQSGYSDCSSFVSKAFAAVGIAPCGVAAPPWPTTLGFGAWGKLHAISRGEVTTGDILLKPLVHMGIATDSNNMIANTHPGGNVKEESIQGGISYMGGVVYLRYVPS